MLVDAVECAGYKAFRSQTRISLRKLTVLFGKNNSGKTTLARLPLLVAASLINQETMYALTVGDVRFGTSFVDLASADQPHPRISLGIVWSSEQSLRVDLQNIAAHERPDVVQPVSMEMDHDVYREFELNPSQFKSALQLISRKLRQDEMERFTDRLERARLVLNHTVHIPSNRPQIERTYTFRPSDAWTVEDAPYILGTDRILGAKVDQWVRDNFDGTGIGVDQAAFAFQLVELQGKTTVNLAESGRGLQAALPVITLLKGLSGPRESENLIIVEEPEEHLHPSAHGAMADLVIDCLQTSQIVVETHSENFILRLRRRIAEGMLTPEEVGLYYIDETHKVRQIPLDITGGTDSWPQGVFESDIEEAQAIVQAKIAAMSHMGEPQ